MGIVIDSNIIIDYEREIFDLDTYIRDRNDDIFLCAVTASEILHGLFRDKNSTRLARRAILIEGILQRFQTIPIDLAIARIHAKLDAELQTSGKEIGTHDCWIAATCLHHGHSLATRNVREFKRVPNLIIEVWK